MGNVSAPKRPVVAMIVDNPVWGDARVLKSARSLRDLGCDVRVVGAGDPSNPMLGGLADLDVELVEVEPSPTRGRRSSRTSWIGFESKEQLEEERGQLASDTLEWRTQVALRTAATDRLFARGRGLLVWARRRLFSIRCRIFTPRDERRRREADEWLAAVPHRDPRRLVADTRVWREQYRWPLDFERSLAPILDFVRPDIIHAHDSRCMGVAVRAAARARRQGRSIKVIYDAHELVAEVGMPGVYSKDRALFEAAHIRSADAVITVSEPLALLLERTFGLGQTPEVLWNAPDQAAIEGFADFDADVRSDCGLERDVPLLVYSGNIAERRGLRTAVAGLSHLPGVHLAVIANRNSSERRVLEQMALAGGVRDRLHLLDFVPRECIIRHLRTADVAISPGLRSGSHEISLPNKFFDYVQAGLPLVFSNTEHLDDIISKNKLGVVHVADDPSSFAEAVRLVLQDLDAYRANVAGSRFAISGCWEAQVPALERVYRDLGVLS